MDSLRGIAALLLVVYHVKGIPKLELPGELERVVGLFGAGVPLFYALSAFSLMLGYHGKLETSGGLLHFGIRRIFRILPLFFTLLIFWLLVRKFYFNADTSLFLMVLNYFCVFGLIPGQHEGLVWASWSIGVEVLFYLVFPFALVASGTLISSSLFFLAAVAISVSSQDVLMALKDKAPSFSYMAISTQIVFFGAGLFAYRLGEYFTRKVSKYSQLFRTLSAEAMFLAGIAFLLIYWLGPLANWAGKFHLATQTLACAWILMLAPVIIHGQLQTLSVPLLKRAGRISFSLYLLNPPIIFFLSEAGVYKYFYYTIPNQSAAFGISLLLSMAILWPLAETTYYFIEEKGIRRGDELLRYLQPVKAGAKRELKSKSILKLLAVVVSGLALPWLVWAGTSVVK